MRRQILNLVENRFNKLTGSVKATYSMGFFDEQFFSELNASSSSTESCSVTYKPSKNLAEMHSLKNVDALGFIDEQYFANTAIDSSQHKSASIKSGFSQKLVSIGDYIEKDTDLNPIDLQLFASCNTIEVSPVEKTGESTQVRSTQVKSTKSVSRVNTKTKSDCAPYKAESTSKQMFDKRLACVTSYHGLVVDLDKEPSYSVVDLLVNSVIYEDENLLCIDKPYKLASQGGPGLLQNIAKHLPEIGKRLKHIGLLHMCHRLDRDTTGLLLIAKNEKTSVEMKTLFEKQQIQKTYKTITRGVPQPPSGIIDLPLAVDTLVNGAYRTALIPRTTRNQRSGIYTAVTRYRITRKSEATALLEITPSTGRKHQIRIHLAEGLGTPVLGDHKYSHRDRNAPQVIPRELQHRLGLSRKEARSVPMHLHAERLTIPSYMPDGKDLQLKAQLPAFFKKTIKLLKMK